jgi:hypothetical protein
MYDIHVRAPDSHVYYYLHLGEVLLGMDNHKAQITPFCRAFMDLMGVRYAITTPNCTDVISPVDRHVGTVLVLKDKIHKKYEDALKSNARMWSLPAGEGGLSDARKRALLATWTSEAWTELCRDNKHVLKRAFVETGFLLAKDGSDRHEVQPYKGRKKRGRSDEQDTPRGIRTPTRTSRRRGFITTSARLQKW